MKRQDSVVKQQYSVESNILLNGIC